MASLPLPTSPRRAISFFFNLSSLDTNEDKIGYILTSIDRYLSVFDHYEDPDLVSRMKREQISRFGAALPLIFPVSGDLLVTICTVVPKMVSQLGVLPCPDRYLSLFISIINELKETIFTGDIYSTITILFKSPEFVEAFIKEKQFVHSFTELAKIGKANDFLDFIESVQLLDKIKNGSEISEILCNILNLSIDSQYSIIERVLNYCKTLLISNPLVHAEFYQRLPGILVLEEPAKVTQMLDLVYEMSNDKKLAAKCTNELFRSGFAQMELIKLASSKEMINEENIMDWYVPEILECAESLEVFIYSLLDFPCSEAYSVLISRMRTSSQCDDIARFLLENTKRYDAWKVFENWDAKEVARLCTISKNLTKLMKRCCERVDFKTLPEIKTLAAENSLLETLLEELIMENINELNVLKFCVENLDDDVCYRLLLRNCLRIENYEKKLRSVDCFNSVREDKECWRRMLEVIPSGFYDFDEFVMNLEKKSKLFTFFQEFRCPKFPSLVCFRSIRRDLPFYELYEIGRCAIPVAIKLDRNIPHLGRVLTRFVRDEDLRILTLRYPILVGKSLESGYRNCEFYELCGDKSCWIDCTMYGSFLQLAFALEKADEENFVTLLTFNDMALYIKGDAIFSPSYRMLARVRPDQWNMLSVSMTKGMRSKIEVYLNSEMIWTSSARQLAIQSIGDKTAMRGAHILVKPKRFFAPRGNAKLVPFMSSSVLLASQVGIHWLFEKFDKGEKQLIDVITRIPKLLTGCDLIMFYERFMHSLVVMESGSDRMKCIGAFMDSILTIPNVDEKTKVYEIFVFDIVLIEKLDAKEMNEWATIVSRIDRVNHKILLEDDIGSFFLAVSQKLKKQTISCKLVGLLMSLYAAYNKEPYTSYFCNLVTAANQFGLTDLTQDAVMYRFLNRDGFQENLAEALFRQKCLATDQMMFLSLKLHNMNLVAEIFERVFPEMKNALIVGKIAERLSAVDRIRALVIHHSMVNIRYLPVMMLLLTSLASSTDALVIEECFAVLRKHGKKVYDEINVPYFVNLLRCGRAGATMFENAGFLLDRFFFEVTPSDAFVLAMTKYLIEVIDLVFNDPVLRVVLSMLADNLPVNCLDHFTTTLFMSLTGKKVQRKALLQLKEFLHLVFWRGVTTHGLYISLLTFCQQDSKRWGYMLDLMLIYSDHNTIIEILNMCEQSVLTENAVRASLLQFQLRQCEIQWHAIGECEVMDCDTFESMKVAPVSYYVQPKVSCVDMLCSFMCPILSRVLEICNKSATNVTVQMNKCLRTHEKMFARAYTPSQASTGFWLSQMHSCETIPLVAIPASTDTTICETEEVEAFAFGLGRLTTVHTKSLPYELVRYRTEFGEETKLHMFEAVYGAVLSKCNCVMTWIGGTVDSLLLKMADSRMVLMMNAKYSSNDLVLMETSDTVLAHAVFSGVFGAFSVFIGHFLIDFTTEDVERCRRMFSCSCESLKLELYTISHGCFILSFKDESASDLFAEITLSEPLCRSEQWATRQISTFEYLIDLNTRGQRSFCDMKTYPVFPRVIKSFQMEQFSLVFGELRNMHKSLGSKHGVSSPSSVAFLNSSLLPFALKSSKMTSVTDSLSITKGQFELTPELFCSPEALAGVALPAWAKSPFHFLELHNYCLEKCGSIEKWFDKVFGFDQKSFDSNDLLYFKDACTRDRHQYQNEHGMYPLQLFLDDHRVRSPDTNYQVKWDLILEDNVHIVDNLIDWFSQYNQFIASLSSKGQMDMSEYCFWNSFVISDANWSKEFKMCIGKWESVLPREWIGMLIHHSRDDVYMALTFCTSWVAVVRIIGENLALTQKKFLVSPRSTILHSQHRVAVTLCNSDTKIWSFASGLDIASINGRADCATFDTTSIFIAQSSDVFQYTMNGRVIRSISLNSPISCLSVFRCGFTAVDSVVCVGDCLGSAHVVKISLDNQMQVALSKKLSDKPIAGFNLDNKKWIISAYDILNCL